MYHFQYLQSRQNVTEAAVSVMQEISQRNQRYAKYEKANAGIVSENANIENRLIDIINAFDDLLNYLENENQAERRQHRSEDKKLHNPRFYQSKLCSYSERETYREFLRAKDLQRTEITDTEPKHILHFIKAQINGNL